MFPPHGPHFYPPPPGYYKPPIPVPVPVETPVAVPVPVANPVPVEVPVPVPVPVENPVPMKIDSEYDYNTPPQPGAYPPNYDNYEQGYNANQEGDYSGRRC